MGYLKACLLFWAGLAAAQNTGYESCDALLQAGLGESLLLPQQPGDAYFQSLDSYYTKTSREQTPWCILQPRDTSEVAEAIKVLEPLSAGGQWSIAVRGGGHSHWTNNNVEHGVTIDLSLMNSTIVQNSTEVVDGPSVAFIGAGSRWMNVLNEVEKYGLSVTAGRVGGVGVAGLTLGGGASFHSGTRGFACDDVVNYEVVLADGSVINANKEQHPDLFKALKGGGNNFGIVTRFDMVAFPSPELYGGIMFSPWAEKNTYVDTFVNVISNADERPQDSQILLFQYTGGAPEPQVGGVVVSTDGDAGSPSFQALNDVTTILDLRDKQTYGEMLELMQSEGGQRNVWFSLCFHNDKRMVDKVEEIFHGLITDTNNIDYPGHENITLTFALQALPKRFGQANPGGNVLGLDKTLKDDSIIWLGEAFIDSPVMDAWYHERIGAITAELEAYAESIGANTPWRYLNYVNPAQDPLKSYGADNVAFIRKVAQEYDSSGFFQTRVSGGFKISVVE